MLSASLTSNLIAQEEEEPEMALLPLGEGREEVFICVPRAIRLKQSYNKNFPVKCGTKHWIIWFLNKECRNLMKRTG